MAPLTSKCFNIKFKVFSFLRLSRPVEFNSKMMESTAVCLLLGKRLHSLAYFVYSVCFCLALGDLKMFQTCPHIDRVRCWRCYSASGQKDEMINNSRKVFFSKVWLASQP